MTGMEEEKELDDKSAFLNVASELGWEVVAHGDWGIQLRRRRAYPVSVVWGGAVLIVLHVFHDLFFLGGVLVWVIGWLIYHSQRDEFLCVSDTTIRSGSAAHRLGSFQDARSKQ